MTGTPTRLDERTLILGLGTGRCGTHSLTDVLNSQPDSSFTHEQWPLLPWRRLPGHPGVVERLRRIRRDRPARFIGDVASFYLPYAEEAIAAEPDIRLICLERPREEVVASFARWLDGVHPLPTDHWSRNPAPGWYHEPFWTRMFPQYDVSDRAAGIRLYWDEYHRTADALARRFPRNFRVFPVDALNAESSVRELLSFAGIPGPLQAAQVLARNGRVEQAIVHWRRDAARTPDPRHPAHCVVLVPYTTGIVPACESALRELERRGYDVRRGCGGESFDLLRSRMATTALLDGFHDFLWIGADIGFAPDDVERLRARPAPIVCALSVRADQRTLNCDLLPGKSDLLFGAAGGLYEVEHAGADFLLARRPVLLEVQRRFGLPICDDAIGTPVIPFFQPVIGPFQDGYRWLESDFGLCDLARQCGIPTLADTTIRLWSHGTQAASWEDVGAGPARYDNYRLVRR